MKRHFNRNMALKKYAGVSGNFHQTNRRIGHVLKEMNKGKMTSDQESSFSIKANVSRFILKRLQGRVCRCLKAKPWNVAYIFHMLIKSFIYI